MFNDRTAREQEIIFAPGTTIVDIHKMANPPKGPEEQLPVLGRWVGTIAVAEKSLQFPLTVRS